VDYLGATHVRPRAWTDEAKDLLRQALIAGEVGLYASRKIRDGTNAVSDAFVRTENLDRSIAFHIALPSDVLRVRVHDCLAPFNGSEIRIRTAVRLALRRPLAEAVGGGLMPSDQSAASASLKSWVLSETAGLG
jgi:hypothetical protein